MNRSSSHAVDFMGSARASAGARHGSRTGGDSARPMRTARAPSAAREARALPNLTESLRLGWRMAWVAWLSAGMLMPTFGAEPNPSPPVPVTVAVFDFDAREELGKDYGKDAAALITAHLSGNPAVWTLERAELDRLLAEQSLGLSGIADPATAARVGQITGARVLVTGRAFRAGNELVFVAKVIGTETSRVYGELVKGGKDRPLTQVTEELAGKLAATIAARADTLIARVSTHADRLEQLKSAVKTTRRPAVSVSISETHFGTPAVDPAAQTELALLLTELGCPMVDAKSATVPELEIAGEAFSELGLRRAGLVSCRARVEITVRDRATGRILVTDRQTAVAVDVGEHTAAKRALSEAAAELALRIIPKALN